MACQVYWITDNSGLRLGIMARPRGGDWLEDEITSLRDQGIKVVASLLNPDEAAEFGLEKEAEFCSKHGIEYLSFPIEDRSVPQLDFQADEFFRKIGKSLSERKPVSIHCRQGIGRAALVAASLLVMTGHPVEEAFRKVATSRGCDVPETPEQREWVKSFAKRIENQSEKT